MAFLHPRFLAVVAFACVAVLAEQPRAFAQVTPSAPPSADAPGPGLSAAELEQLVGPIALYPDDLVAIILPASTYPLQVVQASRFLDKRKANPQLQLDAGWDDSVKSLLNYPEVVRKLSDDLDWTESLGEAVVANSSAVLDAIQTFRRKAQAAGNLKTDAKQVVVVEQEIIKLVPADPQIIYVPQYQPSMVVVAGSPVAYYPTQYPVYHYPYPPGAALATGIIWGAAIGAAWNGGRWGTNYYGGNNNITINRGGNTINTGNRAGTLPAGGSAWKPSRQPGQVGRPTTRPTNPRVGDAGRGGGGDFGGRAGAARPSTQPAGMGGRGDFARGGGQQGARTSGGGRADGGAFGGMGSGGATHQASARGQSSRAGGGGARASGQAGARASGQAGARAGGGARGRR